MTAMLLTDEQRMLRDAASRLVAASEPLARLRQRRASADADGFDRNLWAEFANLGWIGITLPEQDGGASAGLADLQVVLEQLGRGLAPTPHLASELLAGALLAEAGNAEQRAQQLPAVCRGERLLALALQEGAYHDPSRVEFVARRHASGGWQLSGSKRLVVDGHVADALIVIARDEGSDGLSAFLVDGNAVGIRRQARHLIDHRLVADITFDSVVVPESSLIGETGAIGPVLERVIDRATAGLCIEMLGAISALFERTLTYLRDRTQFGEPIGSFQALQHRAAIWHCDIELARALLRDTVTAIDTGRDDAALLVSAAKATLNDLFLRSAAEAIQMHGGLGMTDECDVGLYAKRARVAGTLLGDTMFHRRRVARLRGWTGS